MGEIETTNYSFKNYIACSGALQGSLEHHQSSLTASPTLLFNENVNKNSKL